MLIFINKKVFLVVNYAILGIFETFSMVFACFDAYFRAKIL